MKYLVKGAALLLTVCLAGLTVATVYNNVSFSRSTQNPFRVRLGNAIYLGTEWVREHGRDLLATPNSALFHMLSDMAKISGNDLLTRLSAAYLQQDDDSLWRRLSDPDRAAAAPSPEGLRRLQDYQQWILYAIDPARVALPRQEVERMFAPEMHVSGSLTHQLFAVKVYRDFQGSTDRLDALIDHLCERIAREAFVDFRVSDIYLQRVAFLLAAGRRTWSGDLGSSESWRTNTMTAAGPIPGTAGAPASSASTSAPPPRRPTRPSRASGPCTRSSTATPTGSPPTTPSSSMPSNLTNGNCLTQRRGDAEPQSAWRMIRWMAARKI